MLAPIYHAPSSRGVDGVTPPNLAHYGILRLMEAWKRLDTMTGTCYVENSDARQDRQERLITTRLLTNYTWRTRGLLSTIFAVDPYLSPILAAIPSRSASVSLLEFLFQPYYCRLETR